jgi:hypothetical protein
MVGILLLAASLAKPTVEKSTAAPQKVKVHFFHGTITDIALNPQHIDIYGWCDPDYTYNVPTEAKPDLDIKYRGCTMHYVILDQDGDEQ